MFEINLVRICLMDMIPCLPWSIAKLGAIMIYRPRVLNSTVEESSCCTVIADGSVGWTTM